MRFCLFPPLNATCAGAMGVAPPLLRPPAFSVESPSKGSTPLGVIRAIPSALVTASAWSNKIPWPNQEDGVEPSEDPSASAPGFSLGCVFWCKVKMWQGSSDQRVLLAVVWCKHLWSSVWSGNVWSSPAPVWLGDNFPSWTLIFSSEMEGQPAHFTMYFFMSSYHGGFAC